MSERSEDKLIEVKNCCVELVRLLEAIDTASEKSLHAADAAFWDQERHICRRVIALLPAEFPNRHARRD